MLSCSSHDCPQVEAEGRAEVENLAEAASVSLKGIEGMNGWEGGRVVLVPTDKPIDQWSPIAQKAR